MRHNVLIVGLGSIGRRHARILMNDFECDLVAYRSGKGGSGQAGIRELHSWRDVARERPDIAFITNPTDLHMQAALRCAGMGMHLFIEKPISCTLRGLGRLETLCRRNALTCYTAYCLRFHPVIIKIRTLLRGKKLYHAQVRASSYLPDWRPGEDTRTSYRAYRRQGGGVILELSHEFDYIQYLFGPIGSIRGTYGRRSRLTVDAEDFADALIVLKAGACVNLHLDFFSRVKERSIKVDLEDGCITGDLIRNRVECIFDGRKRTFAYDLDRDDYMRAQTRYFFRNIGNRHIMNGIAESGGLLRKILEYRHG